MSNDTQELTSVIQNWHMANPVLQEQIHCREKIGKVSLLEGDHRRGHYLLHRHSF
jgi:hypothetical protein